MDPRPANEKLALAPKYYKAFEDKWHFLAISILYKYRKLCIGMDLIHLGPLNNLCVMTLNLYENLQLLVRQDIKDCPKSVHTPFRFTNKPTVAAAE